MELGLLALAHVVVWGPLVWALHRWNTRALHPGDFRILPPTLDYAIVPPEVRYDGIMHTSDSDWEGLV